MSKHDTEADARILIDALLRQAGWDPADKSQVRTEVTVSGSMVLHDAPVGALPTGDEARRMDYVLLSTDGRPLAVGEGKRAAIDPYTAKHQTLPLAKRIGAPFIFLSNGDITYFWDYQNDDARLVSGIFSRRDLERLVYLRKSAQPMATVPIPEDYVRAGEARIVRGYQQELMRAMDHALELGKRRFLVELPTGAGKTDVICLQAKRMFKANRAERLLFLVDREQLAEQAIAALQDLFGGEYSSYWLKPGMAMQHKQITVCLLQTMIGRYAEFSSGYFDVVIADECHRSIYGAWQAALTHFDALHIGLTATPAAYIGRNTYQFYQCKAGQPDFAYSIITAFAEKHLVPYRFAKRITHLIAEGTEIDGNSFDPAEFERRWTNEDTNRKMMSEFDRLAWESYQGLAPKQKEGPGKAIVFALTKKHASRLAYYLNELHPEHDGRYAEVITADIPDAEAAIRRFKKDIYPMVAVSVDMLTTGFDCREVLHLVLCRKIFSPILYQQIRGRGTRTCPKIGKTRFVIYDFFRNHEYFNDSETDIFEGPAGGETPGAGGKRPGGGGTELVELGIQDDWLEALAYVEVGPNGERVDKKEYVTHWEETIRAAAKDDRLIRRVRDGQPLTEAEERELTQKLNQPERYYNEENLRLAYRRAGGNIIDFVRHALGIEKLKSTEDLITESFQAWLVTKSVTPEQAQYLSLLKNRGIAKGTVLIDDLFEPPLSILNAADVGIELFGEQGLQDIVADMNQTLFAKQS